MTWISVFILIQPKQKVISREYFAEHAKLKTELLVFLALENGAKFQSVPQFTNLFKEKFLYVSDIFSQTGALQ